MSHGRETTQDNGTSPLHYSGADSACVRPMLQSKFSLHHRLMLHFFKAVWPLTLMILIHIGFTGNHLQAQVLNATPKPSIPFSLMDLNAPVASNPQQDMIHVRGHFAQQWTEQGQRVTLIRGDCQIQQEDFRLQAKQMVLWEEIENTLQGERIRLTIYAEEDVRCMDREQELRKPQLLTQLSAMTHVSWELGDSVPLPQASSDPMYQRAIEERESPERGKMIRTGYAQTEQFDLVVPPTAPPLGSVLIDPTPAVQRHVIISPRSFVPYNIDSSLSTETTPPEQITIISQGVNILVEGIPTVGQLDLSADNVVIYTLANQDGSFQPEMFQSPNAPLQVYLEGNIEIRQADRLIRATHAFYDVRENRGVILNAELKAYLPEINGNIRMKAARIRQLSQDQFHAQNAWITASRMDDPTYRIQSSDIFLENRYTDSWLSQTNPRFDPATGAPIQEKVPWITSLNSSVYYEDVPIFYTPYLSSPAEEPNIPLRKIGFGQDSVFGTQILTTWDLPKLFGQESISGQQWDLVANYYSDRGPAVGVNGNYRTRDLFGYPGLAFGDVQSLYVNDHGLDNLGLDRRALVPPDDNRGRFSWQHKQDLPFDMNLTAEFSYISDRNFEEQYYESQWDTQKDQETLVQVDQTADNMSWSILGRMNLNDIDYQTQWAPKGDLTFLGVPLLGDWLNWSSRSSVGYGSVQTPDAPTDPTDIFTPLPYYTPSSGLVSYSRHEIDAPFHLGALQVTPYAMGEVAYWQDGTGSGEDGVDRFYGSAGIKASLMFSKVFPHVQSDLFNLNGLAHKHELGLDYYYADSSRDLSEIAQYNEFDDDAQERFRTRLLTNTFGGVLPDPFDPRKFLVRSGGARGVADPYNELLDDQHTARLNWRHRLQTKVGPPDRLRIKDWMTFDVGINYFVNPNDNNYGENWGLLTTNYMWDIGARTKFLANTQVDFFEDAPLLWDVGLLNQRSGRGSLFVGYRQIKGGVLDSQIVSSSFSYTLSEKWITTFGTAYDLAEGRDRGQSMTITRVGPDFLLNIGAGIDVSRGNVGLNFSIVPRIGANRNSTTQVSSLMGAP
jgi:hypothetical protein